MTYTLRMRALAHAHISKHISTTRALIHVCAYYTIYADKLHTLLREMWARNIHYSHPFCIFLTMPRRRPKRAIVAYIICLTIRCTIAIICADAVSSIIAIIGRLVIRWHKHMNTLVRHVQQYKWLLVEYTEYPKYASTIPDPKSPTNNSDPLSYQNALRTMCRMYDKNNAITYRTNDHDNIIMTHFIRCVLGIPVDCRLPDPGFRKSVHRIIFGNFEPMWIWL